MNALYQLILIILGEKMHTNLKNIVRSLKSVIIKNPTILLTGDYYSGKSQRKIFKSKRTRFTILDCNFKTEFLFRMSKNL